MLIRREPEHGDRPDLTPLLPQAFAVILSYTRRAQEYAVIVQEESQLLDVLRMDTAEIEVPEGPACP